MKKQNGKWAAWWVACAMCFSVLSAVCGGASAGESKLLIPVGHTVGIKLFSDGVMVVGLAEVETAQGVQTPAVACGLQVGDVIEEVNGTEVESSEQFSALLQSGGTLALEVSRNGQDLTLAAQPVRSADGTWRLGAWIRDSMAGIGTVTYYDPETGAFGALGHGITDNDTGMLMPLGDGAVMRSTVKAVKNGSAGSPGQLRGAFDLTQDMGILCGNTDCGVFGTMEKRDLPLREAVPVASSDEVHEGKATILANVSGDCVDEYEIEIQRVLSREGTQNLLLRVTDDTLLTQTGGIVQGMSGSPILQDGKLVGAVTHVLINDPAKGYGIFIENMLDAAG